MDKLNGKKIRNYKIGERIGSGGYGEVYRATQLSVDRDVAIKVILPQYASDPDFQSDFAAEARLVAHLEHTNIVPLYDYWQDDNGAFLVMRYVRGGTLRHMLKQQGALPLARTVRLIEQIAGALHTAHETDVIHRDLKPGNILIDERGSAYLTDFGIAKELMEGEDGEISNVVKGTFSYMSPEQIEQHPVTPQTDIYALGVMLYEMLAGHHPFQGMSMTMMVVKHLNEPLPILTESRPNLPAGIDIVIKRSTEKDPADRYQNALEIVAALKALATDEQLSVQTARPSDIPQALSQAPKKPTTQANRNRHTMIQNVRRFWVEGVLENSVHNEALITLGMSENPTMVENPWGTVLRLPDSDDEPLPADTRPLDVYDRLDGKLLILGDPGSGKTTTLLELTRELLARAETDETHPIPVVLNLSSWAEKRATLETWLAEELNTKYQVPVKIGRGWVDDEHILPLLDGLDEVKAQHRDACVTAINAYRDEHGFGQMVVCSRIADYEALDSRLKMAGAIVLQPLSDSQIDAYLMQVGDNTGALRRILEDDDKLRRLIQQPIMLNVMTLAYHGMDIDEIPKFDTLEGRREHLFDTYIDRMLTRRGDDTYYTKQKTKKYLSNIAKRMSNSAQSMFYIEDMQPYIWNHTIWQKMSYFFGLRLLLPLITGLVFGVTFGVILQIQEFFNPSYQWYLVFFQSFVAFGLIGLVLGAISAVAAFFVRRIKPVDALRWSWGQALVRGLLTAVTFALVSGFFLHLASYVILYLEGLGNDNIPIINYVMEQQALLGEDFVSSGEGGMGLIFGALYRPELHGLEWMQAIYSNVPTSVLEAQLAFTDRLRAMAIGAMWRGGTLGGLFGLVTGGILGGVRGQVIDQRERANQGIRRSVQFGLTFWIAGILLFLPLMYLTIRYIVNAESTSLLLTNRMVGWPMLMPLAVILIVNLVNIPLMRGGYAAIQHFALRLTTMVYGLLPWNLSRFLNNAAQHVLMRQVGGGYIFIHRMLMEHFANMHSSEKTKRSADTDQWDQRSYSHLVDDDPDTVQIRTLKELLNDGNEEDHREN